LLTTASLRGDPDLRCRLLAIQPGLPGRPAAPGRPPATGWPGGGQLL